MKPFFQLQSLEQVHARCAAIAPLPGEPAPLEALLGRTLAGDVTAPGDLPGFARSTMDGYAVHAADTFGCSETSPAYLTLVATLPMGPIPEDVAVARGECAQIATGGMLPPGADAVVMVEQTRVMAGDRPGGAPTRRVAGDSSMIEISKPVAPGTHVVAPDDDACAGEVVLSAGHCLRPQDLGLLASLGVTEAEVVRRPRVGIISSGDEIVPTDQVIVPGEVRDSNSHTLAALVQQAGGVAERLGLVPDDREALRAVVAQSLSTCDLTLLSGGSSVGSRDLTAEVCTSFPGAELLVHGVTVAPGKPFIWVRVARLAGDEAYGPQPDHRRDQAHAGDQARAGGAAQQPVGSEARQQDHHLLGLPGHVTSCMIAFHLFVEPIVERLLGREAQAFPRFGRRQVTLARGLPAASGRETYLRVRLWHDEASDIWMAEPVFGSSGLLRSLVQSHGVVRIPLGHEGYQAGERVWALTFPT